MRRDSRLLLNEPPLQVLPSLAVAIGLNEAIVLQQIHYWLIGSRHEHDDRRWVYNTFEEWRAQFPFWSLRTIKTVFASLEKSGLILVGHYHEQKWDRTNWYSIDYDALHQLDDSIVQKLHDGAGNARTIEDAATARSSSPENTTENKPDDRFSHMRRAMGQPRVGRR